MLKRTWSNLFITIIVALLVAIISFAGSAFIFFEITSTQGTAEFFCIMLSFSYAFIAFLYVYETMLQNKKSA